MATQMAKKSLSLGKATGWAVGVALATALLTPRTAQAQEATPTGKGIAGGVLLGGELVIAIEAAAGVTRPGAYALGALGGGLLGGVGGYFVEQSVGDAKIPAYMLAGGIALLLPATVLAFNATSYKPPADYTEDRGAIGAEPVADAPTAAPAPAPTAPPPSGGGAAAPPAQGPVSLRDSTTPRRAPSYSFRKRPLVAPPLAPLASVVAFQDNQLRLSLPAVEVRQVFSPHEVRQFGMAQREEVRIPVFQARF
jgi:hypothetical protein